MREKREKASGSKPEKGTAKAESRREKQGSIQVKLLALLIPLVAVVMVALIVLVQRSTSKIVLEKSELVLETSTEQVVTRIEAWMNTITSGLSAERDTLVSTGMLPEEQLAYLRHVAGQYEAFPSGIYFARPDKELVHPSYVPDASYNPLEKSWYQDGLHSEAFIFSPAYVDTVTGDNVVSASAVMKDANGAVLGVAAADIYLNGISGIVADVTLEQTGGTFLVDGLTNMIIGHKDESVVGRVLDDLKDQPLYLSVAGWVEGGELGLREFEAADGTMLYVDLLEVPGSEWVAVSFVPQAEVMQGLTALTRTMVVIAAAAVVILSALIFLSLKALVVRPVKKLDGVARRIAEGDLTAKIEHQSRDEFGTLSANFGKTVNRLHDYVDYIGEIADVLNDVAQGKLDFTLTYDYAGEFSKIKEALEQISTSFNTTLLQINISSDQVSAGSDQLSSGAQALSQGATEQASAVEELSATITELSGHIRANARDARDASSQVAGVSGHVLESNERMQHLIGAMSDIAESSNQIDKIIKTIEDIAFQTNILALNAAVEAARAGEAGKGFAVVADEVRNLANKSDQAARSTAALIQGSVQTVQNGTALADETAKSLLTAVRDIETVSKTVAGISAASEEQAASIAQVVQGVEQISGVVQTNSATAEETAAASEELSAQAQMLRDMVGKFQLRRAPESAE